MGVFDRAHISKRVALVLALGGLFGFQPAEMNAQTFTPLVGLYAPVSDLGQALEAIDFGDRESTTAFGLNVDFGARNGTGFRLGAFYGTDSEVPIDGVGCTTCSARAGVFGAGGALLLRPIPWLGILQPHGIVGAGAKWYSIDPKGVEDLVADQSHFMGQLGVGVSIGTGNGSTRLIAEISDYMSGFEFIDGESGDLQHDFLMMVGLSFGG